MSRETQHATIRKDGIIKRITPKIKNRDVVSKNAEIKSRPKLPETLSAFLGMNFPEMKVSTHYVLRTATNNNYFQVKLNQGEYVVTFNNLGVHLWTDGPFPIQDVKQKPNLKIVPVSKVSNEIKTDVKIVRKILSTVEKPITKKPIVATPAVEKAAIRKPIFQKINPAPKVFTPPLVKQDLKLNFIEVDQEKKQFDSQHLADISFGALQHFQTYLSRKNEKPLIIDIHCGAVDSLLALSKQMKAGEASQLNYVGIVDNESQIDIANQVVRSHALYELADAQFYSKYNDCVRFVKSKMPETNIVIFYCSNLFGMDSLDEFELARFVVGLDMKGVDTYFLRNDIQDSKSDQKFQNFKMIVGNFKTMDEMEVTNNLETLKFTLLKKN